MNLGLQQKTVFVSASGQGIGKAIAEAFLREGAKVLINDRNSARLKNTYATLHKKFGSQVLAILGDAAEQKVLREAKMLMLKKWKKIDVVVPNLGSGKPQNANKLDVNEWQRFFDINVKSAVAMLDIFLPVMKKKKQGSIVLISSTAGIESTKAPYGYAAAKASLLTLMKNVAREWGWFGIRINAVAPGNVYFKGGRWEELMKANPSSVKQYIGKDVPLRRFGTPEEIANAVTFLASPLSSFTTGTCLIVDGGETKHC